MKKLPTKEEMEAALLANGWEENMFAKGLWGNQVESGFRLLSEAYQHIDRINQIKKQKEQGWKFIPGKD